MKEHTGNRGERKREGEQQEDKEKAKRVALDIRGHIEIEKLV
jgi:hypothetical protein